MLNHRLTPYVHDKRDARADLCDVGKVLFRSNANISSAAPAELTQLVDHRQVSGLIRSEVVGVEIAAVFGELSRQTRELGGRKRFRRRSRFTAERCGKDRSRQQKQNKNRRNRTEYPNRKSMLHDSPQR